MKRVFFLLAVLLTLSITGCGGGGGGSSNPTGPSTTPTIVSISPTSGGSGTEVSIQGRNFGLVQGYNTVSYSGATVSTTYWSENLIKVILPSNVSSNGSFQVAVNGVLSNQSAQFSLSGGIISSIDPSSGGPGTQVTLSGQFFGASQGSSYVAFNGQRVSQTLSWSNNQIVCIAPTPSNFQPGNVSVVVWVDGSRPSNSISFYLSVPRITSISPATDNIGATVSVIGEGFGPTQGTSNISIGGINAVVVNWSDTQIQARIPQLTSASSYNVAVTVNGKQSSPYALNVSGPLISTISPATLVKNEPVTITGSHFGSTATEGTGVIYIQNQSDSNFSMVTPTYWSDNQIQFNCPIGGYLLGTQDKTIRITVGGLEVSRTVPVD